MIIFDFKTLECNVEYVITPNKKIKVCGELSDRDFLGIFKEIKGGVIRFSVIFEDTDIDSPSFGSEFVKNFYIKETDIKKIEKYCNEKTKTN